MTRKHFEMIAAVISNTYMRRDDRIALIAELGLAFAKENANFNYDKFKEACQPK